MEIKSALGVICSVTGKRCNRTVRCSVCDLNNGDIEKLKVKKIYLEKDNMKRCFLLKEAKVRTCPYKDLPGGCEECIILNSKSIEGDLLLIRKTIKDLKTSSGVCEYTGLPCLRSDLKNKCEACHIPNMNEKKLKGIRLNGGRLNGRKKEI